MSGIATLTTNVMLALVWAFAVGEFTLANLGVGFVMGFLTLAVLRRFIGSSAYIVKVGQAIELAFYFLWEMIVANVRVAYEVMTPTHGMTPGVIAIPLDAKSDLEITLLANMITLTPGTLSLDVSSDRRVLYIHTMYMDGTTDELRGRIKNGFERRIIDLFQ